MQHVVVLYCMVLVSTAGLAPTVLSLLKAKKAITIFAPTEEAFTNFTLPIFCADQGSDVTNTTIKTTVLLHIVFGAYKNANLVNLDFGAQVLRCIKAKEVGREPYHTLQLSPLPSSPTQCTAEHLVTLTGDRTRHFRILAVHLSAHAAVQCKTTVNSTAQANHCAGSSLLHTLVF